MRPAVGKFDVLPCTDLTRLTRRLSPELTTRQTDAKQTLTQEDNAMNFKKPVDKKFLETLQHNRHVVKIADVIFGIHKRGRSVLYGRERLKAIIASG